MPNSQLKVDELFSSLLQSEFGELALGSNGPQQGIEDLVLRVAFHCARANRTSIERQTALISAFLGPDEVNELSEMISGTAVCSESCEAALPALEELAPLPAESEAESAVALLEETLFRVFRQSYDLPDTKTSLRREICGLVLRISELLVEEYCESSSTRALLALFCFDSARLNSKLTSERQLVVFKQHDRQRWDPVQVEEGLHHLAVSAQEGQLGRYHLEASIAAQHCLSASWRETNWEAMRELYQALSGLLKDVANELNLLIVDSFLKGRHWAIEELRLKMHEPRIAQNSIAHATLAAWLAQEGQRESAQRHFELAQRLAGQGSQRGLLQEEAQLLGGMN